MDFSSFSFFVSFFFFAVRIARIYCVTGILIEKHCFYVVSAGVCVQRTNNDLFVNVKTIN